MKKEVKTIRSNTTTTTKRKIKSERALIYQKYIRSKNFKEVRELVRERQNNICPICGEEFTEDNPGTCHHMNYRWAGYGGEKEASCCVMIHVWEHRCMHRHPKSFSLYSDKNDRNKPDDENHSELANAIRKERDHKE